MLDGPLEEELQRLQWEQFYKEHPDADPIKVIATMIAMVWISGMIMCGALLVIALIAWFFGVV